MNIEYFILLCFSILILSCKITIDQSSKSEYENNQVKLNDQETEPSQFLLTNDEKNKILEEGDINLYNEYKNICFKLNQLDDLFSYSTVMSREFNHIQAYFDIFILLRQQYCFQKKNFEIPKAIADLAIENLLLAYEYNHHQANDIVSKYGISNQSDTLVLMNLICNK